MTARALAAACLLLAAALASTPQPAQQGAQPTPCATEAQRAFDFRVGAWEVRSKARPDAPRSTNVIR